MEPEVMQALLEAFEQSDWQEMTVTIGADRLHVSRRPESTGAALEPPSSAPPASLPASPESPAAPAAPAASISGDGAGSVAAASDPVGKVSSTHAEAPTAVAGGVEITAPSVGLFWRAPAPGAAPFVEVGATVAAGDTVAIVEVMKLMNYVTATCPGIVRAILVENGAPVEFGQALVILEPEA